MKSLFLLILTIFWTFSVIAQPWSGSVPGSIYYNQGNVGIGTAYPVYPLDVVGTIKSRANIGDKTGILLGNVASEQPKIEFNASDNSARFKLQVNGVNTSNERLSMYAGPIGCTAATEALIIGGNGNVGIGTTNPVYPLDVVGTIKSRANIGDKTGILLGNVASEQPKIEFNASDNSARFKLQVNGVNTSNERLSVYAGPIGSTAATETLIIGGNGNVGIGTTSPEAKLTVKGKIVASEIHVKDIGAIPDYVFKPDYELMSSSKVEDYVKQNQHLPEVPSEKEFKENGTNMAEMNALLLKKIEELKLYSIDQNKSLKEQAKKIETLERVVSNLISK